MKKCALVLTVLVALAGFVSSAKADSVDVGYFVGGTFGIPGLGVPSIGPAIAGTAVINYKNAPVGPAGYSALGGFGAFTPLHATARLVGATFMVPVSFTLFGDLITAPTPIVGGGAGFGGPAANVLLSGGTLMLGIQGGASGLVHCTGGTCGGLIPFLPSVLTPFGFALGGFLTGIAATPGSSLLPSFALSGSIGTVLAVPVTAMLTFTEAPLFGGFSRHLIPEPGTAALLGLGLVGMAAAGRRVRR